MQNLNLKTLNAHETVALRYCDDMPFAIQACLESIAEGNSFDEVINEILPYEWSFSPSEREIIAKVVSATGSV